MPTPTNFPSNLEPLISIPVVPELLILPKSGDGLAFVPTINQGRETALPSPVYHSGEAGIDITHLHPLNPNRVLISNPVASELLILPKSGDGLAFVPTINQGRETALPCPLYHSGAAGNDIIAKIPASKQTKRL